MCVDRFLRIVPFSVDLFPALVRIRESVRYCSEDERHEGADGPADQQGLRAPPQGLLVHLPGADARRVQV